MRAVSPRGPTFGAMTAGELVTVLAQVHGCWKSSLLELQQIVFFVGVFRAASQEKCLVVEDIQKVEDSDQ